MWSLFKKEILELSRDRKTLLFLVAMPTLIIPLFILIAGGIGGVVVQQTLSQPVRVAIVGDDPHYQLAQLLNAQPRLKKVNLPVGLTQAEAIKQEKLDLVINIERTEDSLVVWRLVYSGIEIRERTESALNKMATTYKEQVLNIALGELGATDIQRQQWLHPLSLDYDDIADKRENIGAKLGGLIPYLVLITALTGAMYPAIDIGVGEKERGSLETLMIAPLSVTEMVTAKIAVIFSTSVAAALLTILSILLWGGGAMLLLDSEVMQSSIAPLLSTDLVLMMVLILPVSLLYGASMMALSFYAKSMKEAQNYLGYLTFLPIIPVMLANLPGLQLDWGWACVPLVNIAMAMKELAKGTMAWELYLFVWGYSIVLAGLIARVCINWCRRETVLFR